jgi:cytochrome c biogenesis protein CcmG/thiol:disulfide interchange protein DsbE
LIESPTPPAPPADGAGPPSSPSDPPPAPVPGPRRLRAFLIGCVIAALLAIGLFVGLRPNSGSGSGSGPVVAVGSEAPDFTLPSLTGGPAVTLDALGKDRHHPVVLNFFASWCVPCRQETPLLARTAHSEQAKGSTIQFIGVDTLDPKSSAVPFVQDAGISYPVGTDDGRVSGGLYGLYGDPQTFFIDADGTVIGHVRGALTAPELQQWLHRMGATSQG